MKQAGLAVAITAGAASIVLYSMNNRIQITPEQFQAQAQAIVAGKTVEITPDGTPGLIAAVFGLAAIGGLAYWAIDGKDEHLEQVPLMVPMPVQPGSMPETKAVPAPVQHYTPDAVPDKYAWVEDVLDHPLLLIWGASGSGKSTTAEWIVYERVRRGHQVKIFDPHAEYGQWSGLEIIGKGMDYQGIDESLKGTVEQIETRYKQRANQPNCNFRPVTCLCEEMTKWSFQVPSAGNFFKTSLSDLRKVEYYAIYVAHDRTLEALGGSKGIAQAKNNTLLELQLFSELDPVTRKLRPTGTGQLKYPDGRVLEVAIPAWFQDPAKPVSGEFQTPETPVSTHFSVKSETLDSFSLKRATAGSFEPLSPDNFGFQTGGFQPEMTVSDIEMLKSRISEMTEMGMNQSQIIWSIWGFKPGGSKGYQDALRQYKQITGDLNE